jgi:uncharacterized lipoprotein YmbA
MSKSMTSLRFAIVSALIGMALSACSGSTPQVAYYSLLSTDIKKTTEQRHDPLVLSVGPVHIPNVLEKSQIATGGIDGPYRLSDYHRWAGNVDREFARALAEQLAGRLGTDQVYIFPGDQYLEPTCQVQLDVLEMKGDLNKEAQLTVRWTLIDPKGKTAPITRLSRFSEQPAAEGHDAWVKAQQHNISLLSDEISALIKQRTRP